MRAGRFAASKPGVDRLMEDIAALPAQTRLDLMEWIEAAVALRQPRTIAAIESLQLEVLHRSPDDMLDLSQWIMDITFSKQPTPITDVVDRALHRLQHDR